MKLVVHDLNPEEWEQIREEYAENDIISDNGKIQPCIGCFSCWNKTPGQCIIKDGYEDMGYRIHHADEVIVISRYTFGGFSGFVKNVFDRSLGYVLPQFEVVKGETHHQKRYEENKPFTFIFYGPDLGEKEKESAESYVQAVCANIRGYVKEVQFRESPEQCIPSSSITRTHQGKILLLNGSMRSVHGNSAIFARKLADQLNAETETLALQQYKDRLPELFTIMDEVSAVVLCMPLYVDGLPSQVIRFMEKAQKEYRGEPKKIYVLANMGLYESKQLVHLFESARQWCAAMNFEYCGGLGISAGELVGVLLPYVSFRYSPMGKISEGIRKLADRIDHKQSGEDLYVEPDGFPRSLYIQIANRNWNRTARKNGIDQIGRAHV